MNWMWRHRGDMSCTCPGRLEVSRGIVEAKRVTLERHWSSSVDPGRRFANEALDALKWAHQCLLKWWRMHDFLSASQCFDCVSKFRPECRLKRMFVGFVASSVAVSHCQNAFAAVHLSEEDKKHSSNPMQKNSLRQWSRKSKITHDVSIGKL